MGGARPKLRIGAKERIANDQGLPPLPEFKARGDFSKMGMGGGCLRSKALSFVSEFGRSETLRTSRFISIFAVIPKLRVEHGLGAIY
jgi:hypothetical protein